MRNPHNDDELEIHLIDYSDNVNVRFEHIEKITLNNRTNATKRAPINSIHSNRKDHFDWIITKKIELDSVLHFSRCATFYEQIRLNFLMKRLKDKYTRFL